MIIWSLRQCLREGSEEALEHVPAGYNVWQRNSISDAFVSMRAPFDPGADEVGRRASRSSRGAAYDHTDDVARLTSPKQKTALIVRELGQSQDVAFVECCAEKRILRKSSLRKTKTDESGFEEKFPQI